MIGQIQAKAQEIVDQLKACKYNVELHPHEFKCVAMGVSVNTSLCS